MDNTFSEMLWKQYLKRLSTHGSVWIYAEMGIMNTLKVKGNDASND